MEDVLGRDRLAADAALGEGHVLGDRAIVQAPLAEVSTLAPCARARCGAPLRMGSRPLFHPSIRRSTLNSRRSTLNFEAIWGRSAGTACIHSMTRADSSFSLPAPDTTAHLTGCRLSGFFLARFFLGLPWGWAEPQPLDVLAAIACR